MIDFDPEAQFAELNPMHFADLARKRLDDIWAEIMRIMVMSREGKADPREALPWLQMIDAMVGDLRMVGLTVGMLSPWMTPEPIAMANVDIGFFLLNPAKLPTDQDEIRKLLAQLPESDRQEVIRALSTVRPNAVSEWQSISSVTKYSPELAAYRWPRVEDGVRFLESRNVVTQQEWSQLAEREKVRTVYLKGTSTAQLEKLRGDLAQSFRDGESLHTFRKRLDDSVSASKWEVETLFRTQTKQSYLDGVTTVLTNPRVKNRFPFVKYVSTNDNRTRSSHRAWNGKIIRTDSPEYEEAKRLQAEYNCRCTLIPLTERRAEQMQEEERKNPANAVGTVTLSGEKKPVVATSTSNKFGGNYEKHLIELATDDRSVGTLEFVHNTQKGTAEVRASDALVRSQGVGQMLYKTAIEKAKEVGAKTFSSDQRVSPSAVAAWDRLAKTQNVEKREYRVESDGTYSSIDGGPVFLVNIRGEKPVPVK